MVGHLSREEIIRLLSEKSNREMIISFVLDEAKKTLFDIGMNNKEIWQICSCGSYMNPDKKGKWPRIILPQYPNVFVPVIYVNRNGQFVYEPSDFDAVIFTNNRHNLKKEELNSLEKRPNVKHSVKNFERVTGVELSLKVTTGLYELGSEEAHNYVFGSEKYDIIYTHQ